MKALSDDALRRAANKAWREFQKSQAEYLAGNRTQQDLYACGFFAGYYRGESVNADDGRCPGCGCVPEVHGPEGECP